MPRSIYVVRSEPGPVKVGIATKPRQRLTELRVASAVPLHLEYAAETDGDVVALEERAHSILKTHHERGEWFRADSREAVAAVIQAAAELGLDLRAIDLAPIKRQRAPKPKQGKPERYSSMTAADFCAAEDRLNTRGKALADLLGVTRQGIWLWETGQRPIPEYIDRMLRLVEHIGIEKARSVLEKA